ncbi:MAG: phosphomannomutase [Rhodospirillaceae bacterium]|nr:phosphomannomutase [Rhodospirillaceae bacterium]
MPETHTFDPTILREYDIRGVVGKTLSTDDARAIGRAFATLVAAESPEPTICLGYDGRHSSPDMEAALIAGMSAAGATVLRVGRVPTPTLYYAVKKLQAAAGIMVTGSHNPPEYNGFKMMLATAPVYGEQIKEIGRIAAEGRWISGEGSDRKVDVVGDYLDRLVQEYRADRPLTVAWDAGNGVTGEVMVSLTERLPGKHILLNEVIDGSFPNHHPDPTVPENLEELIATVRREKCDLGIAFDGDGDRIGVVDNQGRILWGDQLMVFFAEDVLSERPGATIIADVKASQVLFDAIADLGGDPLMWRTGHSLIKSKMAETGAPLAGEMSGHIFFADRYYGFDDALYAAVRLLDIAARSSRSMAEMRDSLPQPINTPELRFPCSEERKFAVIEEVRKRLSGTDAQVNAIDGVRVTTDDGWWLLRASNTQDVLVARCEAYDQAGLERLKAILVEQLRESGIEAPKF